jgi:hypothetical protein
MNALDHTQGHSVAINPEVVSRVMWKIRGATSGACLIQ